MAFTDFIPPHLRPWDYPDLIPGVDQGAGYVNDIAAKDERVHASELLRRNGFPESSLREGVATMGAESGFDPNADNGICCIGLMQVNVDAHKGTKGIPADRAKAVEWLKIPDNNCKVAHTIWVGAGRKFCAGNGNPWEANCNGRWRNFVGQDPMITVKKNTGTGGVIGDIADVALGPLDEIASALLSADTWFRIGKGTLGGVLVIIGIGGLMFVVANKVAKTPAVKAATSAIPAGKVAKVVSKA